MENQIDVKERELKFCNRRAEDLSSKLGIIRQWCEWLTQPPGSQLPRPDRSPYFETDEVGLNIALILTRTHAIEVFLSLGTASLLAMINLGKSCLGIKTGTLLRPTN